MCFGLRDRVCDSVEKFGWCFDAIAEVVFDEISVSQDSYGVFSQYRAFARWWI